MSDAMIRHGFGEIGSRYYTHADTEALRYDCTPCLRSENQALQERIEEALKYLDDCENGLGTPSTLRLRTLLSTRPTQETDPE